MRNLEQIKGVQHHQPTRIGRVNVRHPNRLRDEFHQAASRVHLRLLSPVGRAN
jgi:hypothetical protein